MTSIDRDELAEIVFEDWVPLYCEMTRLESLSADKRRRAVAALRKSNDILKLIVPMMRDDPALKDTADMLAAGAVESAANWLDRQVVKPGKPPSMSVIGEAAYQLGEISKAATGKPEWGWVETKLAEKFDKVPSGSALRSLAGKAKRYELKAMGELDQQPVVAPAAPAKPDSKLDAVSFFTIYNIRAQRHQDLEAAHRRWKRKRRKAPRS